MTDTIIHVVLLIARPPLLLGIINKTKAWFGGRNGPPVLQTYYDIIKLMRKGLVVSTATIGCASRASAARCPAMRSSNRPRCN